MTPDLRYLRDLEFMGRLWLWSRSDPRSRGPAPSPDYLTDGERLAATPPEYRFDAVPLDQFDEILAARMSA